MSVSDETPVRPAALQRLAAAADTLKTDVRAAQLIEAVRLLDRGEPAEADKIAVAVLEEDEANVLGWRVLATARERQGDFTVALMAAEQVVTRAPDTPDILNDLGRIAYHLKRFSEAEQFFLLHLQSKPRDMDALNNLACTLRDQFRLDEAAAVLKAGLEVSPGEALLWNNLATVQIARGDPQTALVFFDEAIRLDANFAKAFYNRGNLKLLLGDAQGALEDGEEALRLTRLPTDRSMMRMAIGLNKFALGRIAEGLEDYEARLDPEFDDSTVYPFPMPKWTPDDPLAGRRLLLVGEQGLGDEVAFSSMIPDLLTRIGPEGRLYLAVEPRLIPLFRRSFPEAVVGPYATGKQGHRTIRIAPFIDEAGEAIDYWAPMAAPMRLLRRRIEDFPAENVFFKVDPARVAHWRSVLAELPPGPKIGVLWKSLIIDPARSRQFTAFDTWQRVLTTPGAVMVNLQYGDCSAELEAAKARGMDLWRPPGIDLKDDLDDLAALTVALDLVVGPANATTNIAAASGGEVSLVALPGAWIQFGTRGWPFYPRLRVMEGGRLGDWSAAIEALRRDIQSRFNLPEA